MYKNTSTNVNKNDTLLTDWDKDIKYYPIKCTPFLDENKYYSIKYDWKKEKEKQIRREINRLLNEKV